MADRGEMAPRRGCRRRRRLPLWPPVSRILWRLYQRPPVAHLPGRKRKRKSDGEAAREGCGGMAPRRGLPAPPLEDDDLLAEILLRLPPRPSSLPRAAAVCRLWRLLVSDPSFHRRFRAHHREPPLLGLLQAPHYHISFTPAMDLPDRIPTARFSLRIPDAVSSYILGCRHGRVLLMNPKWLHFLVWVPMTGDQHRVALPPGFDGKEHKHLQNGAIACAAGDQGHMHGACHSSPFQVVFLGRSPERVFACAYSSETEAWGNLISLLWPPSTFHVSTNYPNTMVGNSIYWLLHGHIVSIIQFDLDRQSLAVIEAPPDAFEFEDFYDGICDLRITPADGAELGFLVFSRTSAQLWKRNTNSVGVSEWVLGNTIELKELNDAFSRWHPKLLGLDEDDNMMFLWTSDEDVFAVHIESGKFRKLPEKMIHRRPCYPLKSFYTAAVTREYLLNVI
ncbi:hypothetical protein ACP70R_029938 [Stipagrostis hirtigluma subsp. patula]